MARDPKEKPSLVARNLSKSYGKKEVLSGVSFEINAHQVVALLGPSGCGKSTLLRIIAGIEDKGAGDLTTPAKVAYVPQQDSVYPLLTVRENLEYFSELSGNSLNPDTDYLGLSPGQRACELSGGQRKRLSILIATLGAKHAPLLILDEPTVGLDPASKRQVLEMVFSLGKRVQGVLLVTHHMQDAEMCDKAVILARGRVVADDSPRKIVRKYRAKSLEEAFERATKE